MSRRWRRMADRFTAWSEPAYMQERWEFGIKVWRTGGEISIGKFLWRVRWSR